VLQVQVQHEEYLVMKAYHQYILLHLLFVNKLNDVVMMFQQPFVKMVVQVLFVDHEILVDDRDEQLIILLNQQMIVLIPNKHKHKI
jgi:hypothetical protein